MTKGIISMFILPTEVEDLITSISQLKINSIFNIKNEVELKMDITVCLSDQIVDWTTSKIHKEYIKDRVLEVCEKYLDWCQYDLQFEEGDRVLGCVSQRRESLKKNSDADFFIWLDPDIVFNNLTLYYIVSGYKIVKEAGLDMFVITPQFVKQWDNTWDIIVNKDYWNNPINYQKEADIFLDVFSYQNEVNITQINNFKFAGGWFTLISKPLLDKIGVPESFGHYGLEDTFIMACSQMMVQKGERVAQFTMENLICGENYRYRTNEAIKKYISIKDRREEFRKIAESNWQQEISNFNMKL